MAASSTSSIREKMEDTSSTKSAGRFKSLFKSKPPEARKRLRKAPQQQHGPPAQQSNYRSNRGFTGNMTAEDVYTATLDSQTGERKDYTEMLHSLGLHDPFDAPVDPSEPVAVKLAPLKGELLIARLSPRIWARIAKLLGPADLASLAFTCKAFRGLLGSRPWTALNDPENYRDRINFLVHLDQALPHHLLCSICGTYHVRIQEGKEELKPANILNPLFVCPYATDNTKKPPRMRIAPGRTLPFTFVQLATRADRYLPSYGIPAESLSRRWKHVDSGWSHYTRYFVQDGHLFMRVISSAFAPPGLPPSGQRYLLYSREDFWPYFSACAHWRDGHLMNICKCALGHIPEKKEYIGPQGVGQRLQDRVQRAKPQLKHCSFCQPMRRCPECPTEYLVEIKLVEDRTDPSDLFKQAIVVTRWSDLGDGRTPWSPEWASCKGEVEFDSFEAVGRRAISGVFESHFNPDVIPGQRIISLNPKKDKKGEAGNDWY